MIDYKLYPLKFPEHDKNWCYILEFFDRDYHAEGGRKETVEEFYRTNHINQTYDFVSVWSVCLIKQA